MERETAMKILKELHNKSLFAERTALETIIPELKESEDERVKKRILLSLEKDLMATKNSGCDTQDLEQCIVWLEKQGESYTKKDVDDAYLKGICDAKHELDKQGEQKPAVTDFNAKDWYVSKVDGKIHDMTYNPTDKVEPKFHKGEWIVWENKCYKVNYNGCGYELIDQNGLSTSLEYGTVDTSARLYDITKDAKDGDVIFDKSDGTIGIFQSMGHHPDGGSFNDPSYCFLHCHYDDGFFYADFEDGNIMDSYDAIPATKEQRDTLMKAMTDAGYEWNAEKKELKKIEETINGEDYGIDGLWHAQRILEKTLGNVDGYQSDDGILEHKAAITAVKKLYEQKPTWSYEDEANLNNIIWLCNNCINGSETTWIPSQAKKIKHLIETVKERGLSQQKSTEWSGEDEEYLQDCIGAIWAADYYLYEDKQEMEAWLKRLKNRIGG